MGKVNEYVVYLTQAALVDAMNSSFAFLAELLPEQEQQHQQEIDNAPGPAQLHASNHFK